MEHLHFAAKRRLEPLPEFGECSTTARTKDEIKRLLIRPRTFMPEQALERRKKFAIPNQQDAFVLQRGGRESERLGTPSHTPGATDRLA